jgi:hypothetical protein
MINEKSPGSDGYTVDFYKFFWKDIGPFVFRSLFYLNIEFYKNVVVQEGFLMDL